MKSRNDGAGLSLARHLAQFGTLSDVERDAVIELVGASWIRSVKPRVDLIHEGDRPRALYAIASGWACRYRMLADGRRQLISLLLPGDFCDLHNDLLDRMDHSIGALTALRVAEIDHARVDELSIRHPVVGERLRKQMLVSVAVQREWTVNLGQRGALERLAHLFCELLLRLQTVGLADAVSFEFPLTQSDIADAIGLTSVHVNRMLQQLRAAGLVRLAGRVLTVPSFDKLAQLAYFTPGYLHLRTKGDGRTFVRSASPAFM